MSATFNFCALATKLQTNFTVNLIINRSRVKQDGMARLYLSINVEKEFPVKIKLPLFWPADFYCLKTHSILPRIQNDPDHAEILAIVETEKSKYWNVAKKFYLSDRSFTAADIIKGVNTPKFGSTLANFIETRAKLRYRDKQIKEQTLKNHRATASKLLQFLKNDIPIASVSSQWLKKYQNWLLTNHSYGAVWSHLKVISAYIRDAEKFGIEINDSFKDFRLEPCESNPVWLTKEEVMDILDVYNDVSQPDTIQDVIKVFLFGCFTGLRISDLKRFDTSWIQDDEIVFTPIKGRLTIVKPQIVKIPVIEPAKQFLKNLEGKIVTVTEQEINRRLKVVADIARINKKLTTHVARHTFGTLLAAQGVPLLTISALMGHKKVSTTMVYIHIYENIRKTGMEKL